MLADTANMLKKKTARLAPLGGKERSITEPFYSEIFQDTNLSDDCSRIGRTVREIQDRNGLNEVRGKEDRGCVLRCKGVIGSCCTNEGPGQYNKLQLQWNLRQMAKMRPTSINTRLFGRQ